MLIRIVLVFLCLITAVDAQDVAVWEFSDYGTGYVSYIDDEVVGFRASVLSKTSGSKVYVNKSVCCGSVELDNSLSDSDSSNVMLMVADAPELTGHFGSSSGWNSLTIEVEFTPALIKTSQLVRKTDGNTATGYMVFMTSDGKIGFTVGDGVTAGSVVSRNSVEIGKSHRVIVTWENRFTNYNMQVMLDGIVSRASSTIGSLTNTTYPLTIGGLYRDPGNYGQFFSGVIKRVAISTERPRLLDVHGKNDPLDYIVPTGEHLEGQNGFVKSEFIYEVAKHPECHASSIVDLGNGQLGATWFGGTCEGHIDCGVWYSRYDGEKWSEPAVLAEGPKKFPDRDTIFNPALIKHSSGKVLLFYGVGTLSDGVEGKYLISEDNGLSWSNQINLPVDIRGTGKNKPVELSNGNIVCPTAGSQLEITTDLGTNWFQVSIPNTYSYVGVIQPTVLIYPNNKLQALFRTQENRIAQSLSFDNGMSWSTITLTSMPNNNSGIDAVGLADGRYLLVYNHSTVPDGSWGGPRTPLNVAVSNNGTNWYAAFVLEDEDGEYSYPSVIQSDDGLVHIVYTWKRLRVKHVVVDPSEFSLQLIEDGVWPW